MSESNTPKSIGASIMILPFHLVKKENNGIENLPIILNIKILLFY
jgi:hypothetical protein